MECAKCHSNCDELYLYSVLVNDEEVKMCYPCVEDWYEEQARIGGDSYNPYEDDE